MKTPRKKRYNTNPESDYPVFLFLGGEFIYVPERSLPVSVKRELIPFLSSIEAGKDMTRELLRLSDGAKRQFQLWLRPGVNYSTDQTP